MTSTEAPLRQIARISAKNISITSVSIEPDVSSTTAMRRSRLTRTPGNVPNRFDVRWLVGTKRVREPDDAKMRSARRQSSLGLRCAIVCSIDDCSTPGSVRRISPEIARALNPPVSWNSSMSAIGQRCRTVVEPLVSKQWFVKTKDLAAKAIASCIRPVAVVARRSAGRPHKPIDGLVRDRALVGFAQRRLQPLEVPLEALVRRQFEGWKGLELHRAFGQRPRFHELVHHEIRGDVEESRIRRRNRDAEEMPERQVQRLMLDDRDTLLRAQAVDEEVRVDGQLDSARSERHGRRVDAGVDPARHPPEKMPVEGLAQKQRHDRLIEQLHRLRIAI